jgi:hypothetical protein
MKQTVAILGLVLILGACQQRNDAASTQANPVVPSAGRAEALTPEQLGALGAEIRKDPARGDELLQQHGLTREAFEKAIRDVTESADASQRYAAAYRKASA